MSDTRIKVIDLFAGPGGLGEGFTSLRGKTQFDIALSIEKDKFAHKTLAMRARFRELQKGGQLAPYYMMLNGQFGLEEFLAHPAVTGVEQAVSREALLWEMNPDNRAATTARIREELDSSEDWILIGGPPCQAYSLVGRARNRNVEDFQEDARHFLYQEYLEVLKLQPAVFVMENVKGLLSSQNRGEGGMFERIREDFANTPGHGYKIHTISMPETEGGPKPSDFIVRSENYGVPQARHRVILLGIRNDLKVDASKLKLVESERVPASQALDGLPGIRSRLSRDDSFEKWHQAVQAAETAAKSAFKDDPVALQLIDRSVYKARNLRSSGAEFIELERDIDDSDAHRLVRELHDPALSFITGHRTRSHMESDLQRYFYAAIYTAINSVSPKVQDFPDALLPNHRNVKDKTIPAPFQDRFRVLRADEPAHTVVAHMAKDGHAFIHWDPEQIRSLTIREAARLQTFPDNYLFMGPQTARYTQVGNAVPPLLARQIAEIVARIFD